MPRALHAEGQARQQWAGAPRTVAGCAYILNRTAQAASMLLQEPIPAASNRPAWSFVFCQCNTRRFLRRMCACMCALRACAMPEVEQLLLFKVRHCAAVGALHIISNDLQGRQGCDTQACGGETPSLAFHMQQHHAFACLQGQHATCGGSEWAPAHFAPCKRRWHAGSLLACRLGLTLTVARGTSSRLRLSCCASVFWASRLTRTFPSNTPRPEPAATMHLNSIDAGGANAAAEEKLLLREASAAA